MTLKIIVPKILEKFYETGNNNDKPFDFTLSRGTIEFFDKFIHKEIHIKPDFLSTQHDTYTFTLNDKNRSFTYEDTMRTDLFGQNSKCYRYKIILPDHIKCGSYKMIFETYNEKNKKEFHNMKLFIFNPILSVFSEHFKDQKLNLIDNDFLELINQYNDLYNSKNKKYDHIKYFVKLIDYLMNIKNIKISKKLKYLSCLGLIVNEAYVNNAHVSDTHVKNQPLEQIKIICLPFDKNNKNNKIETMVSFYSLCYGKNAIINSSILHIDNNDDGNEKHVQIDCNNIQDIFKKIKNNKLENNEVDNYISKNSKNDYYCKNIEVAGQNVYNYNFKFYMNYRHNTLSFNL
jgi:hypothetical protein